MPQKTVKLVAGILGLSGVTLGALGAHALKAHLATGGHTETWATAVLYHLIHTVAILAVSMKQGNPTPSVKERFFATAAMCWLVGIVLFSGSLYALALGGPHWLGPITPLGGLAFLVGWGCVLANGWKSPSPPKNE